MEEVELPVFENGHLAQQFEVCNFPALGIEFTGAFALIEGVGPLLNDEHLLSGIYKPEILLGIFVFVLAGTKILEITVSLTNAITQNFILLADTPERVLKKNVAIIRERVTECHEPNDCQADDDR